MISKTINDVSVGDFLEEKFYIKESDAVVYASITGDNNKIHFDEEYAQNTLFKSKIAHGMLLGGYISGIIGTKLPGQGCIYANQSLEFVRPVRYGDEITIRVAVEEIKIERNRITLSTKCINQNGELVVSGKAIVLPKRE